MDYAGSLSGASALLCIGAGPLAGAVYGLVLCRTGGAFGRTSGAVSLLLTGFNLLPVLPLDGGRLVGAAVGETAARGISRIAALLLLLGGGAVLLRFHAVSVLPIAVWLALGNFRPGSDL